MSIQPWVYTVINRNICLRAYTYMCQKDQDGYYAEKCNFFSTFELKYTILKTGLIKSKSMQCTILSIRVIILKQNGAGYTRGPPRGTGGKRVNNQQFFLAHTDWNSLLLAPLGTPSVPRPILLRNNDSYRHNSALNIFTFDQDCY